MKLHKTNNILIIEEGRKSVERRVYIDELGALYVRHQGDVFRIDHFEGRSTLFYVDHRGRKCVVRESIYEEG